MAKGSQQNLWTYWKLVVSLSNCIHRKIESIKSVKQVYKATWCNDLWLESAINNRHIIPIIGVTITYNSIWLYIFSKIWNMVKFFYVFVLRYISRVKIFLLSPIKENLVYALLLRISVVLFIKICKFSTYKINRKFIE